MTTFGEVKKKEPSFTAGGNTNWYSHYGKQSGGSSKNYKKTYYMSQKSFFWVST